MSFNRSFDSAADGISSIPTQGTATAEILGVPVPADHILSLAPAFAGSRLDPIDAAAKLHVARLTLGTAGGGIAHDASKDTSKYDAVEVYKPRDDDGALFRTSSDPKPAIPGLN
ncbi:MAG: hypothetical protein JWO78_1740 [Micavibrio sp.]|nr:hypothetical protein [Micavibrio sp.]